MILLGVFFETHLEVKIRSERIWLESDGSTAECRFAYHSMMISADLSRTVFTQFLRIGRVAFYRHGRALGTRNCSVGCEGEAR